MTDFVESKPLIGEEVLIATIVPAASDDALQIFDQKKHPKVDPKAYDIENTPVTTGNHQPSEHVFEKEHKKMIVLGKIEGEIVLPTNNNNNNNNNKPRSTSPRNNSSNNNINGGPISPRRHSTEPSESLMKPTAARVRDNEVLEDRRRQKDNGYLSPSKRKSMEHSNNNSPYAPSERLLRPTQSRIADVKEWEAHKERLKYEDDIWWEKRKPAELSKPKPNTPSKLMEPTAAFAKTMRPKYDPNAVTADTPPKDQQHNHHHVPAKIDKDSPLLKRTTASIVNSWKQNEIKAETHKPVLHLPSQQTGPQQVESKLNYDTQAAKLNHWKSKEQLQKEKEQKQHAAASSSSAAGGGSGQKKVKGCSPRLLELNESLKMHVRPKLQKPEVDPREAGWQLVHKASIPTIDEMHDSLVGGGGGAYSRTSVGGGSSSVGHRDSSGSLTNSRSNSRSHDYNYDSPQMHIAPEQEQEQETHEPPQQPDEGEPEIESQEIEIANDFHELNDNAVSNNDDENVLTEEDYPQTQDSIEKVAVVEVEGALSQALETLEVDAVEAQ